MTKTDHLARAKDYIAKGEDYHKKAAVEIVAAIDEDGLSQQEIAVALGRSRKWVQDLIAWAEGGYSTSTPYIGADRTTVDAAAAKKVAREQPEAIAAAISAAPPEAQRKIADELIKSPATESSLKKVAERPKRQPREPKAVEQKLSEAVFAAWEVGEMLLDAVPSGEERVRMTALAEKGQRLHAGILHLLGTGELEDEFAELVRQVGAES